MTATLVDSNVFLDVLTNDATWFAWSSDTLALAADRSRIVINPVIYAEISVRFSRIEELDDALPNSVVAREAIPYEAAFLAGKAFRRYRHWVARNAHPSPTSLSARIPPYRAIDC